MDEACPSQPARAAAAPCDRPCSEIAAPDVAARMTCSAPRSKSFAALALAAIGLAGCQTAPTAQVTRFHMGAPVARGQIAVEPLLPADRDSLEAQSYASIIGAELAKLGFTEAPGLAQSEQVAAFSVERGTRDGPPRSSPIRIGIGGGSYGWSGGVGGGVSFPVGKARNSTIAGTRLLVQIKRRSDGTVVWEGRGETAARLGTPAADGQTQVRKLAAAMFAGFPGESGRTITVK
jgi:hypothetical protein